jgi:acetylornithine/succinyldiaminopimelate/putrescine aminotransferase
MGSTQTDFVPVELSLADICGEDYVAAACRGRSFLTGESEEKLLKLARHRISFYPKDLHGRITGMLDQVGHRVVESGLASSSNGASIGTFNAATKTALAPVSGFGPYRIGEDGVLYLATKSEHYHASLGHGFPGYQLIEHAHRLGIPNATHNNTRGHITRITERALVATVNGLAEGDTASLDAVLESQRLDVMNRVLNLETGSLALEAALKMILARFYRVQPGMATPENAGKTPVILVVGDEEGGLGGNYHGTTVLTQIMRGMWPELAERLDGAGTFRVVAVRPNNQEDLVRAFEENNTDTTRVAGFFHEIVMMNYGGLVLSQDFLHKAYALCAEHDVPTVCDEIQSCIWNHEIFMFREYGLKPTFVSVGKGFPGGEYPASRIIFSAVMDNDLPQFGALVTNGQEELASLAYLITLAWAKANAAVTKAVGEDFSARLRDLAGRFDGIFTAVEGYGHMSTLYVRDLDTAKAIATALVKVGLDISAQTYKADCPPALLTKLPLIAGHEMVESVVARMERVLEIYERSPVTAQEG